MILSEPTITPAAPVAAGLASRGSPPLLSCKKTANLKQRQLMEPPIAAHDLVERVCPNAYRLGELAICPPTFKAKARELIEDRIQVAHDNGSVRLN